MKAKSELGGDVEKPVEISGSVLDIQGDPIDPVWAAEFRGFFWGEGTLSVQCHNPPGGRPGIHRNLRGQSISIMATIGLRSDDSDVLRQFHMRLGGRLRTEPYRGMDSRKTITRWAVGKAADCQRISRLLVSPTGLTFNKARQLGLWTKALDCKLAAGAAHNTRYTDEQRDFIEDAARELKDMRVWNG